MTTPSGDQPVEIERGRHGDFAVLRLAGELDLRTAPELREALLDVIGNDEPAAGVLLDMSGVVFLDSTIISVLLVGNQRASAAGKPLRLVAVAPHVARIFDVTGIRGVLAMFASLDEAAAAGPGLSS